MKPTRQSANLLLVLIALIAVAGILFVGYLIIDRLMKRPFDPYHGQGTNSTPDGAISLYVSQLESNNGPITAQIPGSQVSVPAENLSFPWHYTVSTSSNLSDWQELDIEWEEALENLRTNHSEPMRFYQRSIWWTDP